MRIHSARLSFVLTGAVLALGLALAGCGSDKSTAPTPTGHVGSHYVPLVDGQDLVQGQLIYTNPAGQQYSVTRFQYLITDIRLYRANGSSEVLDEAVVGNHFGNKGTFDKHGDGADVPVGTYTKLSFRWGKEWAGSAQATENLDSEYDFLLWPEVNGGGYHCMRFEGNYTVDQPGDHGFVLHMGRLEKFGMVTETSTVIEIPFPTPLEVKEGDDIEVVVAMELNNWLNDPLYDFTASVTAPGFTDPQPLSGPTMTNHVAQQMFKDNIGDVFSFMDIEHLKH